MAGLKSMAFAAILAMALSPGAAQAKDVLLERGAYLANGVVACGNCHTPKGPDGRAIPGQELSGGFVIEAPVFRAVASNITPDPAVSVKIVVARHS
ncbi:MAG: hypothetical protein EXR07_09440 [Acetobacteraceae bacterium]|nr:hypothetical protein [Acetobacteraceae bacterium]